MVTPVEGDVWWAAPDTVVGREQGGRRPVLVVSGQEYHDTVTTLVLAVPITSRDRDWPNHVLVTGAIGLGRPSWAMTEQVRAMSRDRLVDRVGSVTPPMLGAVRTWISDYLR